MAKKEKRISINKLESIMQENVITVPLKGAEDTEIIIRKSLPLKDMMQFIEDVVSSCVDIETGDYTPEARQFAIFSGVLTYYGNFKLPENIEKQYELIYNTNAVEQVLAHINKDQLDEIVVVINEKIDHKRNMIESVVAIKTNELISRIETFAEQFENMLGGISSDDIGAALKALATADSVDEETLVKAVFDARRTAEKDIPEEDRKIIALPKDNS